MKRVGLVGLSQKMYRSILNGSLRYVDDAGELRYEHLFGVDGAYHSSYAGLCDITAAEFEKKAPGVTKAPLLFLCCPEGSEVMAVLDASTYDAQMRHAQARLVVLLPVGKLPRFRSIISGKVLVAPMRTMHVLPRELIYHSSFRELALGVHLFLHSFYLHAFDLDEDASPGEHTERALELFWKQGTLWHRLLPSDYAQLTQAHRVRFTLRLGCPAKSCAES